MRAFSLHKLLLPNNLHQNKLKLLTAMLLKSKKVDMTKGNG